MERYSQIASLILGIALFSLVHLQQKLKNSAFDKSATCRYNANCKKSAFPIAAFAAGKTARRSPCTPIIFSDLHVGNFRFPKEIL
ncbi:MAG: hypothetical protein IKD72_00935 [Clostridia bacterium]|nr:hypothetical protein [Clostridia bacterium]